SLTAIVALFMISCPAMAKVIMFSSFGAVPDDGVNDMAALKKAVEYCRSHPGTTLVMEPGVYDIEDDLARKIEREAISGAYGERVQSTLFKPGAPYVKALDLTGCKDVTVSAQGATLCMKGWYEVVTIDNVSGVTVDGLSITYNRPPNTVGRVIASDDKSFDMLIDPSKYTYIDSIVTGRVHFYDHVRNRLYTGGVSAKELVNPSTIRIHSTRHPAVGDYCILRHGGHYRPAVMIKESKGVTLSNVKIHGQPGMGVVGHRSSDIMIDNLQVVPEPGSVISTNTDATHFTSCSGDLTIQNSKFRGQGDDCTNIHNYYYRIYPRDERNVEIRIENADLHAQSLDYPEVGDSMIVIDRRNMAEVGRFKVREVNTSEADWQVVIGLDRPLGDIDLEHMVMTNLTRFPRVKILNNTVNSHLARAFLVKAPNVTIARNSIIGSCETAIKLGAELGWNESGPAYNVLIEDNYISGCGYNGGAVTPACVTLSTEASERPPFVNHHIVIRNNIFDTDKPVAVLLKDGEYIEVYDNKATRKNYVRTDNCRNITIKE
ncbi:MAG: right-handed parallel beta-helix repeat-containing protein, partial [Muribaculaceae bacterium]|nr:right-handed parallel beta-helix repeat-containing protein [Muribaculaceae bacterium]